MMAKPINLIFIILLSSAMTNGVRRKSKIDLPIVNAAEAPFDDNVALASTNDAQQLKNDAQPAQTITITEKPTNSASSAAIPLSATTEAATVIASSSLADNGPANVESDVVECDPDMIGFEIITGYVQCNL